MGVVVCVLAHLSFSNRVTSRPSLAQGFHAVGKFAAVKIIVFATYYQSLLVAIPGTGMDELGGSERWNDFILCIEMALFAVMHMRVFSHAEFLPDGQIMCVCAGRGRVGEGWQR
jgi:hypothetical protein